MSDFEELDWVKYKTSNRLLGMVLEVNELTLVVSSHSGIIEIDKEMLDKCTSKGGLLK